MPERAFIYLRISTEDQEDGGGYPRQRENCLAFAERAGIEVVDVVEEDVSGKTQWFDRPVLKNLVTRMFAGEANVLIVEDPDRAARLNSKRWRLIGDLEEAGLTMVDMAGHRTDDDDGEMMWSVKGGLATRDYRKLLERTLDGRKRGLRDGKWMFPTPYGYGLVDGTVMINALELPALDTIVSLYLEGHTNTTIIAHLEREGHPTRYGRPWNPGTLARLLTNADTYASGELRVTMAGEAFTHKVDPLLTRATVAAIKTKRIANKSERVPRPKRTFLLRGLLTSACGRTFQAKSWAKKGKVTRGSNYRCPNRSAEHHEDCARSVGAVTAEQHIMEVIKHTILDEDASYAWIRTTSTMLQTNHNETKETIAHAEVQLRRLNNERLNLDRQLVRGAIDERNHGLLTTENAGEVTVYEAQLAGAKTQLEAAQNVKEFERRANDFIDRGAELSTTPEGRAELCHALIEQVYVSRHADGKPEFELKWRVSVKSNVSGSI